LISTAIASGLILAQPDRVVVTSGTGAITYSSITTTKLGYLTDVGSNIQAQLDGKQATITGGATTIASANLTAGYALVSDGSGKVAVKADVSSTKLGYLTDVTSNLQAQINNLQSQIDGIVSPPYTTIEVEIGPWNMDATDTVTVAHGVTASKIRSVTGFIRNDAGTNYFPISYVYPGNGGDGTSELDIAYWDATNIYVTRRPSSATPAGFFDNTTYDDTGFSRGSLIITYEP